MALGLLFSVALVLFLIVVGFLVVDLVGGFGFGLVCFAGGLPLVTLVVVGFAFEVPLLSKALDSTFSTCSGISGLTSFIWGFSSFVFSNAGAGASVDAIFSITLSREVVFFFWAVFLK